MSPVFKISVLTREKTIYEGEASSLVAPGEAGYLGILANHAPLATSLIPGKIVFVKKSGETETLHSGGKGFLNVLKNDVTLLLESAEAV
jgi:F-type H+-transporting ATPase subunit epsilon